MPDYTTLLQATRSGAANLELALVPWVWIAAFGLLVYQGVKIYQGNVAMLSAALLRVGVAAVLVTNFPAWMDTITDAVQTLCQTVQAAGGGTTSASLMAQYDSMVQNPGKNDTQNGAQNWWQTLTNPQGAVGDAIFKAILWLWGWVVNAIVWLMGLVQRFLVLLSISVCPIFIGMWILSGTTTIAMRYFLNVLGLTLWPLGWAVGNIVTQQLFAAVAAANGSWLMFAGMTFVVIGLWLVTNALFWPIVISKAITSGAGHGGNWMMSAGLSAMSVGQVALSAGSAAASGGGSTGVAVSAGRGGAPSLATRPV